MTAGRRSIFLVGRREITERTQGRAFLISTLAIVALVLAGVIVPALNDQTTNDGSPFATAPASVRGNVANRTRPAHHALGYFAASEVAERTAVVR